jgi:TetR/AcrR family transcriptional repressor of nem operon
MRLTKAQRQENHDRILSVAARLFREKGVDGVGIDEIMAAAELTHGAFYGHFASKAALVSEAGRWALEHSGAAHLEALAGATAHTLDADALVALYLSDEHRDNPGRGCAIAALAADIGRQDAMVQASFAAGLEETVRELAERLPGDPATARREAIYRYSALAGALAIARSVGKSAFSEEVLAIMREHLAGA